MRWLTWYPVPSTGSVLINEMCCCGTGQPALPVSIRVIAATRQNLWALAEEGRFRKDLYYAITTLTLKPVPLRERKEDLVRYAEDYIENFCKLYSKYIKLTKGAMARIAEYPWEGNVYQLRDFCEKLVLTSNRRSVDEIQVEQLLNELPVVCSLKNPS